MSVQSETKMLLEQAASKGVALKREDILSYARNNPSSDLWADFQSRDLWNDSTAAEIARLNHAGGIIMRYRIVNVEPTPQKEMRGTVHFDDEPKGSGFRMTEESLDGEPRVRLIKTIVKRVIGEMSNYPLPEFEPIHDACQQVLDALKKPPKRRGRGTSAQPHV